jgi:UDP-2,3-diacylglucosamine hydrolase
MPLFFMHATAAQDVELQAPAHWRSVELISDLHLHAGDSATFDGWRAFLQRPLAQRADALFILGDLFEVWVGDDVLDAAADSPDPGGERHFLRRCAALLLEHSQHTPVFFMPGNRDFLLGPQALSRCGMQALIDPTVLSLHGQRYMLSHGDALCLDDTDYMRFRAMVRNPAWQNQFLARPLPEREAIARELRQQSEARKSAHAGHPELWADPDATAVRHALQENQCTTLLHGHTHRPADHELGDGMRRVVLSDWDLSAQLPRAQVLRIDAQGLHRQALAPPAAA